MPGNGNGNGNNGNTSIPMPVMIQNINNYLSELIGVLNNLSANDIIEMKNDIQLLKNMSENIFAKISQLETNINTFVTPPDQQQLQMQLQQASTIIQQLQEQLAQMQAQLNGTVPIGP